jgi:hypothetical protein
MSHLSWKKNRDTGGVTCMESYVGNTPPNERFSLWDVCFMCFFGAAAKRYAGVSHAYEWIQTEVSNGGEYACWETYS